MTWANVVSWLTVHQFQMWKGWPSTSCDNLQWDSTDMRHQKCRALSATYSLFSLFFNYLVCLGVLGNQRLCGEILLHLLSSLVNANNHEPSSLTRHLSGVCIQKATNTSRCLQKKHSSDSFLVDYSSMCHSVDVMQAYSHNPALV